MKGKCVGHTGFEPVTSALSRQRSKPTELMTLRSVKYRQIFLALSKSLAIIFPDFVFLIGLPEIIPIRKQVPQGISCFLQVDHDLVAG